MRLGSTKEFALLFALLVLASHINLHVVVSCCLQSVMFSVKWNTFEQAWPEPSPFSLRFIVLAISGIHFRKPETLILGPSRRRLGASFTYCISLSSLSERFTDGISRDLRRIPGRPSTRWSDILAKSLNERYGSLRVSRATRIHWSSLVRDRDDYKRFWSRLAFTPPAPLKVNEVKVDFPQFLCGPRRSFYLCGVSWRFFEGIFGAYDGLPWPAVEEVFVFR